MPKKLRTFFHLATLIGLIAVCVVAAGWLIPNSQVKPAIGLSAHQLSAPKRSLTRATRFFALPEVSQIVLQLDEAHADKLRADARSYVKCQLIENGGEALNVGLKLKGAAGSFRELDDRQPSPSTLTSFANSNGFHALEKFYLNNSVQDESYFSEWLCASICRSIRLPPRITFAHVWLNERDLGL